MPTFFSKNFIALPLTFTSLDHSKLIFNMIWERSPATFSAHRNPVLATFVKRTILSTKCFEIFWHLLKINLSVGLFLDFQFYPIDLYIYIYGSTHTVLIIFKTLDSSVLNFELGSESSNFLKDYIGYYGPLYVHRNFRVSLSMSGGKRWQKILR